jgi:hypothetical protein
MRQPLLASIIFGAMLLGLSPATVSAAPASSLVPTLGDVLSLDQSPIEQVSHRRRACHWHQKCGWKQVCRWRYGHYRCGWKWRCWSWCHKHHRKRRLYYYNY